MKRSIEFSFETGPAPPRIQIIGLGFVAIVTGSFAVWTGFRAYDLEHNGMQTIGTVVALEQSDETIYPVFSFIDNEGRRHEVRASISNNDYTLGDTLNILYPSGKPLKAHINGWWSLYFMPVLLSVFSIAFFIAAGIFVKFKQHFEADFKARRGKLQVAKVNPDGSVVQSTRSSAPLLKWISRIFGVAAIVFFCSAGWAGWRSHELARDGVLTEGIVTKLTRTGASHRPWLQFTDSTGETQIIESAQTTNDYLVGDEVRVIYLSSDPKGAQISVRWLFILMPAYFVLLGMICLLITLMCRNQLRSITDT